MKRTHKPLIARLPATPCTEELRDRANSLAEQRGKSLAALNREAMEFFLHQFDTNSISNDTERIAQQ